MNLILPGMPGNGPWQILLLDRDPQDAHWLIATVALADDIRVATLDAVGRYQDWPQVTAWTAARLGLPIELTPVHDPLVWTIRRPRNPEGGQ